MLLALEEITPLRGWVIPADRHNPIEFLSETKDVK